MIKTKINRIPISITFDMESSMASAITFNDEEEYDENSRWKTQAEPTRTTPKKPVRMTSNKPSELINDMVKATGAMERRNSIFSSTTIDEEEEYDEDPRWNAQAEPTQTTPKKPVRRMTSNKPSELIKDIVKAMGAMERRNSIFSSITIEDEEEYEYDEDPRWKTRGEPTRTTPEKPVRRMTSRKPSELIKDIVKATGAME